MSDKTCMMCNGEGGWHDMSSHARPWIVCDECNGKGYIENDKQKTTGKN